MDEWEKDFESYLREFSPRRPSAVPDLTNLPQFQLRRLAAAALLVAAFTASLPLLVRKPAADTGSGPAMNASFNADPLAKPVLQVLPLTKLALEDPVHFDEKLSAASRTVLPDFAGARSTLRALARE
jgi:hypothetical protein